jgi:cobalamin biosynthesis Mg chelatase CobN
MIHIYTLSIHYSAAENKLTSNSMFSKSTSEFWTTKDMRWTSLEHTALQETATANDFKSGANTTTVFSEDLPITEKSKQIDDYQRSYDDQQFKKMLKSLKVKKKKVSTKEAPGSQAIGVVAILILLLMFTGVILLDLNTFQQNWKLFRKNVSDARRH